MISTLSIKAAAAKASILPASRKAATPFVLDRPITTAVWSNKMSFTSPEADFCTSAPRRSTAVVDSSVPTWSRTLSFASAETDFTDSSSQPRAQNKSAEWSNTMSFTSPEADFTAEPNAPDPEWSEHLSFASPESDFTNSSMLDAAEREQLQEHHLDVQAAAIMQLAFSSPESASGHVHAHNYFDRHEIVRLHQQHSADLPESLEEALADNSRAIVVTEATAPFRIVNVNDAWVNLCEFSREEAQQKSLRLIQGPDTNTLALTAMVDELLHGKPSQTLVTNYTKAGRKFYNRLRAGPLYNAEQQVTHFVGILQEVTEEPDYFHQVAHA